MRHLHKIVALCLLIPSLCFAESGLLYARISLEEATHKIISEGQLKVLGAFTEIVDGKEVHVIKVLTPDGHIRHYRIDAETGNSLN